MQESVKQKSVRAETPASLHVSTPQETSSKKSLVIKGASGAGNIRDSKTEKKAQANLFSHLLSVKSQKWANLPIQ